MIQYSFFGYMLAVAIILMACVFAYRLLFENRVRHSINRLILLSIYALSFITPLLISLIPESQNGMGIEMGQPQFGGLISDFPTEQNNHTGNIQIILNWLSIIYICGLLLTLLFSIWTISQLFILWRNSKEIEINGSKVFIHNNKQLSTFTWGNKILLYQGTLDSQLRDMLILLSHEKAHLEKRHWIDLAFAQMVLICQWFNPAAWFMRKELQRVHEYEADEVVLQSGVDEKDYQMLLINHISGNRFSGLTDGLNNCSLKKRIIMMQKTRFKNDWMVRGIAICGFAILGGFIIHVPAVASVLQPIIETEEKSQLTIKPSSTSSESELENLVIVNEESVADTQIVIDGKESSYEEMSKLDPNRIDNITVYKDPAKIIINLKDGQKQNSDESPLASNNIKVVSAGTLKKEDFSNKSSEPVAQPDVLAEYPGGPSQLLKDLSKNIQYPEEAQKNGIEGKVVVKFQVNTNGTLSDCDIAYSQNPILNDAALKAVESLPGKWKPAEVNGKPVASVFNLPVTFSLMSSDQDSN